MRRTFSLVLTVILAFVLVIGIIHAFSLTASASGRNTGNDPSVSVEKNFVDQISIPEEVASIAM